jgi:hypothetical protein
VATETSFLCVAWTLGEPGVCGAACTCDEEEDGSRSAVGDCAGVGVGIGIVDGDRHVDSWTEGGNGGIRADG